MLPYLELDGQQTSLLRDACVHASMYPASRCAAIQPSFSIVDFLSLNL